MSLRAAAERPMTLDSLAFAFYLDIIDIAQKDTLIVNLIHSAYSINSQIIVKFCSQIINHF